MSRCLRHVLATPLVLALFCPLDGWAEGTAELGDTQYLLSDTPLYVDIVNPAAEEITWTGDGTLTVYDPDGTELDELSSGESVSADATKDGAYTLVLSDDQSGDWDITVETAGVAETGRLWSTWWELEGDTYDEEDALKASLYVLTDGGGTSSDAVVEVVLEGWVGYYYALYANGTGVDGDDAGRSVEYTGSSATAELPVYLNPPAVAVYGTVTPTLTDVSFDGGDTDCAAIAPGVTTGEFLWTTDVEGRYHLVCDANGDGTADMTDDEDLWLVGDVSAGDGSLSWDGEGPDGDVAAGDLDCVLTVVVGEVHWIAEDIESSYEGLRMFAVDSAGTRDGLAMFWNDTDVQSNATTMPSGDVGLETSGAEGIASGSHSDSADPNVNARSWGDFSAVGKGNAAYLDTWAWAAHASSSTFTVTVLDPAGDEDTDGLLDIDEECTHGTDRTLADTDGDGLDDNEELSLGSDPLDEDTDGDGRLDGEEAAWGDTDEDGEDDVFDPDDDGDGIPTEEEDGEWSQDADGDGTPNYRDTDSDNEGGDDATEGTGDSDGDGLPDYVDDTDDSSADDDRDGDGLSDADEAALGTDPDDDDSDDDGVPDGTEVGDPADPKDTDDDGDIDALDADDDGDGILSADEDASVGVDTDGDGDDDYLDTDSDDDGVPDSVEKGVYDTTGELPDSDGDGVLDYRDKDSDDDGVPDGDEVSGDTDGDGWDDRTDDDDDGDSHLTATEIAEENAVGGPDIDGDGAPAYLDTDSDGDGLDDDDPAEQGDLDNDGIIDWLDPLEDTPTAGRFGGGGLACASGGGAPGGAALLLGLVALAQRRRP